MSAVQIDNVRDRIQKSTEEAGNLRRQFAGMRRQLEQIIGDRIEDFAQISQYDLEIRRKVFREETEFDAAVELEIGTSYREWFNFCEQFAVDVRGVEAAGFKVRQSEEFLKCFEAVRGLLSEDATFFSGPVLVEMKDRAIDEHRSGTCS
ncbi:hypothetical protein [Planctomicrobium piriforme]|uniref:Uncharacterized protein n=1 Tax=Planctomicrobium piriforme TaxID=1576369 RepID=A0A1I3CAK9_9PLAN|nr:hypothetical protein [Planctomicrobium piriforme]SFH71473.1 hypothetical protein SAMN05421753_102192 [Planctomicrobium piriforme]